MRTIHSDVIQHLGDTRRHRRTTRGTVIAVAVGTGLALLAIAFKGAVLGWLIWAMFCAGALACSWDGVTGGRP